MTEATSTGRWLPMPQHDGLYEISERGFVRSITRMTSRGLRRQQFIKTPIGNHGYPVVTLTRNGVKTTYLVRRLLLEAFRGPCPPGEEARHLDGNRAHCELSNLKWDTHEANMGDKRDHGTDHYGKRDACSKGHEYTEASMRLDLYPDGSVRQRVCRTCENERYQEEAAQRPPAVAVCAQCGCTFEKPHRYGQHRRKYCGPACAKAARRKAA